MSIFTGQIDVNEALSFINTDILSKIKEGMILTKDYALELGGRYAQFVITQNIVYLTLCLIGFIVAAYFSKKIFKRAKKVSGEYDGGERFVRAIFSCASLIPLFCGIISFSTSALKRKFVPEIQMYQVIMDIKNGSLDSNKG